MTFDTLFADGSTLRIEGARSSGAARSMALDAKISAIGKPGWGTSSTISDPQFNPWRIIQVREVKNV